MPGVEFASDCSGSFPEFKMADGGEGGRDQMIAYVLDGVFLAAGQLHPSQNVIHGSIW